MQARSAAIIGWACSTHELLPRECGRCKCGGLKGIRSRKLRVMSAKPPKSGTPNFEAVHSLSLISLFLSILDRPNKILLSNAREVGPESTRSRRMDKIYQPIWSRSQCADTPLPRVGQEYRPQ